MKIIKKFIKKMSKARFIMINFFTQFNQNKKKFNNPKIIINRIFFKILKIKMHIKNPE